MTKEQIKALNNGAIVQPTKLQLPTMPNKFAPPGVNEFNEGIPDKPDPNKDFNQMPLSDIEFLSGSKHMDDLHRTDALAESYKKGENLKSLAKNLGKDKFKEVYKVINQNEK